MENGLIIYSRDLCLKQVQTQLWPSEEGNLFKPGSPAIVPEREKCKSSSVRILYRFLLRELASEI